MLMVRKQTVYAVLYLPALSRGVLDTTYVWLCWTRWLAELRATYLSLCRGCPADSVSAAEDASETVGNSGEAVKDSETPHTF